MSVLFTEDESGNVVTAADAPSREVVCLLESFGYKPEAVRKWSAVKASSVLNARRKEDAIVRNRAAGTAATQDETVPRGQPTAVERWAAALALEQAMRHGADETLQAVAYTAYCLTDDELKSMAALMVLTFRGKA